VYNLEEGLALAKEQNRPVMIDFYADWCAACKELEAFTYTDPAVDQELDRFVNIKLDYDRMENQEQVVEEYDIVGLPLVVFYNSAGERLPEKNITGYVEAETFLEHIQDIQ
jgi:thiol:disulfide interchange protein DsbD